MKLQRRINRTWLAGWGCAAFLLSAAGALADDAELARQVDRLVSELDADTVAERDIAETNLLNLAELQQVGPEKLLATLPVPNDNMPTAVRQRLTTIRATLERQIARSAVEGSRITLEAINWPLSDVLAEIEQQTGNTIRDDRQQFGDQVTDPEVIVKVEDEPFWAVIDQVLDQAQLSPYAYAGEDALALVARDRGEVDRYGRAEYVGPFRLEVTEVNAVAGLRNPTNRSLNIGLEIAWEPRLRPIAITQPVDRIAAVTDTGEQLASVQPGRVFNIEVPEGTVASTITLPLALPERSVTAIETLSGTMTALVPGQREAFRFENLAADKPVVQSRGGVQVTLQRVRKNGAIWEVHMNFTLEGDTDALASHRGWVFGNLTYLEGPDGEPIDHVGFETTKQTTSEVGLVYLFDLPDGVEGLTWVYETPAAIVEQPYRYRLTDIPLP